MSWSNWTAHNGSGYPVPIGTKVLIQFRICGVQERVVGDSGEPEFLTSWTWSRDKDGTPRCPNHHSDPVMSYKVWQEKGTESAVERLKKSIQYDEIAKLIADNEITEDSYE